MKKEYKNVTRSKNSLREALILLLNSGTPLEDISVSDLCEKAGVNRGTFYNHYKEISDLIQETEGIYLTLLENTALEVGLGSSESRLAFFRKVNEIIEQNKLVAIAVTRCMPYTFRGDLQKKIADANIRQFRSLLGEESNNALALNQLEIVSMGIAAMYAAVIIGRSQMTTEDIAVAASSLLDSLIASFNHE